LINVVLPTFEFPTIEIVKDFAIVEDDDDDDDGTVDDAAT
jgi:hypothetical protein